ncbi:hypothetical protein [Enterobacter kobei]|uniref:hypothetical protein n=1 Tax=Enterobacter kobei TaxID=208224 RepID=UPI00068148F4|nr:hypothetical protein [Enterobacter kobei]
MPVNVNNVTTQNGNGVQPPAPVPPEPVLFSPGVYPAVVAVAAGSTTIIGLDKTVIVQNLVNPAAIATYTLVLPAMSATAQGFIVVSTLGGITALTVTGGAAIPANALATANSSLVLRFNGTAWVIS